MRNLVVSTCLGIVFFATVNVLTSKYDFTLDLTEDRIYTFSNESQEILGSIDEEITVTSYFNGDLPSEFRPLQNGVDRLIFRLKRENHRIAYRNIDPTKETGLSRVLVSEGLAPMRISDSGKGKQLLVFPYLELKLGEKRIYVNVMEGQRPGESPEEGANRSIALLEYKVMDGLLRIFRERKFIIGFTEGHGEMSSRESWDLRNELSAFYDLKTVDFDSIDCPHDSLDLLIICRPTVEFSEREKWILDQWILAGVPTIFMVDGVSIGEDELMNFGVTTALRSNHQLDDLLFRYGIRINPNLVFDLNSTRIPLVVGQVGDEPQIELYRWPFYVVSFPASDHPIVSNMDGVRSEYASSIDTLGAQIQGRFIPLLQSSEHNRLYEVSAPISLDMINEEWDPNKIKNQPKLTGVLVEGVFQSMFKNRLFGEDTETTIGCDPIVVEESQGISSIVVLSDGDVAKNEFDPVRGRPQRLGYDRYENYQFANLDLLLNTVDYLTNEMNILSLKNRNIRLRLLDPAKVKNSRFVVQLTAILFPIACILLIWGITFGVRKHRYGKIS